MNTMRKDKSACAEVTPNYNENRPLQSGLLEAIIPPLAIKLQATAGVKL